MNSRIAAMLGVSLLSLVAGTSIAGAGSPRYDETVGAETLKQQLARPGARRAAPVEDDSNAEIATTRGLVVRSGSPANATRVAAVAPPSVALDVKFEFNSAQLTPEAKQLVAKLAEALNSAGLASDRFALEGYTDSVGKRSYNVELSQRRAHAVRAYLAELGVRTDRIEAVGRGPDNPLDPLHPESGVNRRVQVVNVTR